MNQQCRKGKVCLPKFGQANFKNYLGILCILFALQLKAQRPSIDSIYKKGSLGIGLSVAPSIAINVPTSSGRINVYHFSFGTQGSYFFKNRWAVYTFLEKFYRFSNAPDISPLLSRFHGGLGVRYHLRHFYFGGGSLIGNNPFLSAFTGYIAPRTTWIVFANSGLYTRLSIQHPFWKQTFFSFNIGLGKTIFTENIPDGFSSTDGIRPISYFGLFYHFQKK